MEELFPLSPRLKALAKQAEEDCRPVFDRIGQIQRYNEQKVLKAFRDCRVSETHFVATTGYGYGDRGRENLDEVYAAAFGCEDALVRYSFVSGTHALSVALFGVLRTGDTMVSLAGGVYDTMEEVIGLRGEGNGSLKDYGISYRQVDLTADGKPDYEAMAEAVKGAKVGYLQRSRGYSLRESFTMDVVEKIIRTAKEANPDLIVIVDNCYGEFVDTKEPVQVGADLMIGSLIKNPGGGIARTGGYIAGRHDLIELCGYRLTAVGMGREVGCSLGMNRELYLGFFFAPSVTASALKTGAFALRLFELMGYEVFPAFDAPRSDIISAINLKTPEALVAFCQGIQAGSPVDSFVKPEPWDMPGYSDQVVMAAGAFTMGASSELSADGPIRPPYAVWLQGGLTYETGRTGVLLAAQEVLDSGAAQA